MTTIRVGQAIQLLYAKGWGPGCMANTDLVNPVYFGHDQSLSQSSDQIPALGAIPVDGSRDIYGSTLAGGTVVAVQSMPGVTNWAPSPAQAAAQINALGLARDTTVQNVQLNTSQLGIPTFMKAAGAGVTTEIAALLATGAAGGTPGGVPLLGFKNVLGSNAAGLAIGANALVTLLNNLAVSQIGYEMLFSITTAAVTASPVTLFVSWSDSVTGLTTDSQTWTFFAGSNASPHSIRIVGPVNGDRLTVAIQNGANAITVKYSIMQTSRVYTRHFGHTRLGGAYPGFTAASADPTSNILCAESQSVGANAGVNLLLPLYSGTARLFGTTTDTTGANSQWLLFYNSALLLLNDNNAYKALGNNSGFSPAGQGSAEAELIAMPRTQMSIQLFNHNTTTTQTLTAHLIAQEMQT